MKKSHFLFFLLNLHQGLSEQALLFQVLKIELPAHGGLEISLLMLGNFHTGIYKNKLPPPFFFVVKQFI